ncbi:MAG: flagellar hook basal-body protein, partial [bacterium]|nr:flagellar hook basal-body protein [bacterium]
NTFLFFLTLLCVFFLVPDKNFALRSVYEEVTEPAINISLQSMRAHQIQMTNYLMYTLNANTPGYIETGIFNIRSKDKNIHPAPFVRWRTGPPIETGRDLDFYCDSNGMGFFTVRLPGNNRGYTRDGRFTLNSKNQLVMLSGDFPVVGEAGNIFIPEGSTVTVTPSGVIFADGEPVDKMKVTVFTAEGRERLVGVTGVLWVSDGDPLTVDSTNRYKVRQWHIEQNNVLKSIQGDISLCKYTYEATAKIARAITKSMNSAIQLGNP